MDSTDAPKPNASEPKKKGLTRQQRRNISEGLKRVWLDPAYRKKVTQAIREGMARRRKKRKEESRPQPSDKT